MNPWTSVMALTSAQPAGVTNDLAHANPLRRLPRVHSASKAIAMARA
jgi:hypothetical protein